MHTIEVDVPKNRLIVTLVGFFSYEEMKKCTDETIAAVASLKPGFEVITDISQYKVSGEDTAREIERAQEAFVSKGVRRGVRVVGSQAISGMQFKRTAGIAKYDSVNVATLEEAKNILDSGK
jgi:hypothetical protein